MSMNAAPASRGITSSMIECLEQTRPWVRLLSILGFVGAVFMVLAALLMIVVGGAGMVPGMGGGGAGGMGGVVLGLVYLLLALLYIFPSYFLFRYAGAISSMDRDVVGGMERALAAQKSFWRFVGIVSLVYLVLILVFIGFMVVVAVTGFMRH
jgi:hypothetical protein